MKTIYMLVKGNVKEEEINRDNLITTSKTLEDANKKHNYWNQFYECKTIAILD